MIRFPGAIRSIPLLTAILTAAVCLSLSGCGDSTPVMHLDDAVQMTEETLTESLLGPSGIPETDPVPREQPLLHKGVYETILIGADEKGFERISHGLLHSADIRDIEDRVTLTVGKRIGKRGFTATRVDYPVPGDVVAAANRPLIATLVPRIEEAGSPSEKSEGKGRHLILIRLTISDPKLGTILAARDYYSGTDAPNGSHDGGNNGRKMRWRFVDVTPKTQP